MTLVSFTESVLTWRRRRRLKHKARRQRKSAVRDWAEAILSAVVIVLLINQYLLQAYVIPSPSMVPALIKDDRLFVSKLVYGPELIPGMAKLPGFRLPERGEVIIFESPDYISRGPVLDIIQRVVYMLTLSLVDIDKGQPGDAKHFLVKRAVGVAGDRVDFREGELRVLRGGEQAWVAEPELQADLGTSWATPRIYNSADYIRFRSAGIAKGMASTGLVPSDAASVSGGADTYFLESWNWRTQHSINPANPVARSKWATYEAGIRVDADEILPLGDNRDNSQDGRYFGPVKLTKVLGRALFRYWPLARTGTIR